MNETLTALRRALAKAGFTADSPESLDHDAERLAREERTT